MSTDSVGSAPASATPPPAGGTPAARAGAAASVVIPAHNEERVIGRLLAGILAGARAGEFDITVVCNGCTDGTEAVVSRFCAGVRMLSTPVASKANALRLGDRASRVFPRIYVDADVEIDAASLRLLARAVAPGGHLAAGPERVLDLAGRPWPIRAYYSIWQRLPAVQSGLIGRGVIAIGEQGHPRVADIPDVINDDLFVGTSFAPHERTVVAGARSTVHPPRRLADLLRRRTRASMGNVELAAGNPNSATTASSARAAADIAVREPRRIPAVAVFATVTVLARTMSVVRRLRAGGSGDVRSSAGWLRDESSRI